jgi:hypothetical protein
LDKCKDMLTRIQTLLKSGKKESFTDHITWAFSKKQRDGDLLNELEKCKTSLSVYFDNELLYFSSVCIVKLSSLSLASERALAAQERQAAGEERKEAKQARALIQNDRDGCRPS